MSFQEDYAKQTEKLSKLKLNKFFWGTNFENNAQCGHK